jgi:hypothetical protein
MTLPLARIGQLGNDAKPLASTRTVRLAGHVACPGEPLLSPVSGASCAYWRLRIVEELEPTLRLVHEMASSEPFEIIESPGRSDAANDCADEASRRVRILPGATQVQGISIYHRPGSAGARAAALHFELSGALGIEETLLHPGDAILAEGLLEELDGIAGPFRATMRERELVGALVRTVDRASLAPVLLPWALGTAAALLGGVGMAAWAASHSHWLARAHDAVVSPVTTPTLEMGPPGSARRHFSQPE